MGEMAHTVHVPHQLGEACIGYPSCILAFCNLLLLRSQTVLFTSYTGDEFRKSLVEANLHHEVIFLVVTEGSSPVRLYLMMPYWI